MSFQVWSWVLGFVGLIGFYLAGKKVWWSWYINIANQLLWLIYSLVSEQYGFLVATAGYSVVFVKNAIEWTRQRGAPQTTIAPIGRVTYMHSDAMGLTFEGVLNDDLPEVLRYGDLLGVSIYKSPEIDLKPKWHWRKMSPLHIWRMRQIKKQFREAQEQTRSYPVPLYANTHIRREDVQTTAEPSAIDIANEEMRQHGAG